MAWLTAGGFLLLLCLGRGLRRGGRPLLPALAAAAALAAFSWSFTVYPEWVPAAAFAGGGLLAAVLVRAVRPRWPVALDAVALFAGAALCLFALFGPADGLL